MTRKEAIEAYENAKSGVRKAIYDHIREFLKKQNKTEFSFSKHPAWDEFQSAVGCCTVTYDGGNHPEYASNAFSEVYGVCLYGDDPCVIIDESDEYELDRVWSLDELIAVDEAVEFFEDYDPYDTLRQLLEEKGNDVILEDSVTLDSVYNNENIIVTELVLGKHIHINTQMGFLDLEAVITDWDDIYTLEYIVADL